MDNVIELKRPRFRSRSIDKRLHPRLDSDDPLFIQIVATAGTSSLLDPALACRAVDFSMAGVQFSSPQAIAPGTVLDLWIDATNRPGRFFLSGEVRWCRHQESDDQGSHRWRIGVRLHASTATDYHLWHDYLSSA